MFKRVLAAVALAAVGIVPAAGNASAAPSVTPDSVERLVYPGGSFDVDKTVGTAEIPPKVDVCLLEDETGSFGDDIANLKNPVTTAAIFDGVRAISTDSQFAVSGFRDVGDAFVYRQLSSMSANFTDWQNGINALSASGGGDTPEAQFDAIVSAVSGAPYGPSCGFRADPQVARVLIVATDAPFHGPGGGRVHNNASTIAALTAANVTVIGLKAPGSGGELDALAAATGGTVQALSSNGANIASAILAGLGNLPVKVAMSSDCVAPIGTSFAPAESTVTSGDNALFVETISVDPATAGGTYTCVDHVSYNGVVNPDVVETKKIHVPGIDLSPVTDTNELGFDLDHSVTATVAAGEYGPVAGASVSIEIIAGPNAGTTVSGLTDANGQLSMTWTPSVVPSSLGTDDVVAVLFDPDGDAVASDDANKLWVDTTPPVASCVQGPNPGGKVPRAPGNGGQGQNQDGFYKLLGTDVVWPAASLQVYVIDNGSGTQFGPFAVGTNIKYTQAIGATPSQKAMTGAVQWHISGKGDAVVKVVDGSGNSASVTCLVPPAPK